MKKIGNIVLIGMLFLLCGCGDGETAYQYSMTDVAAKNEEAQNLYNGGNYEESLTLFLDAMQEEPKDASARIGVIKSQIALENYDMALVNLNMSVPILAHEEELYDLYIQVSKLTDNISIARNAVELAKRYGEESFLERVPEKPVLGVEGGKYSQKMEVTVTAQDEGDVEIYVNVKKKDGYQYYNVIYQKPWVITSGETKLTAYCVRDGIPSETIEATYICEYAPTVVQFADPVMEQLVRNTISRPEGEITDLDCEQIDYLSSYNLQSGDVTYEEYQEMKIKSLADLKYFTNLTSLVICEQAEIADYSQVCLCPLLSQLTLTSDGIEDIAFVSELPQLNYLYVENNQIRDVKPVLQCKNLRGLEIEGNPINDLSELKQMQQLYMLRFDYKQFQDLTVLEQWETLTDINIYCTGEDDISVIGKLEQLESLSMQYDYWQYDDYEGKHCIKDISFVGNLENLTYLNISGLQDFSQLSSLKNLTKLQNLYLYNRFDREHEAEDAAAIADLQRALPTCNISY